MDTNHALDHYIDLALEQEKATYPSTLESFDAYAAKFRIKVSEYFHVFSDHFLRGYQLLKPISTNDKALSELDSFEKVVNCLSEGKSLYHHFGYSQDTLISLYQAAHKLVEEKQFEDGYDAYFFLVAVAPHIREAWLNFGYTMCQLGDHFSGIEAFGNALELDPTTSDSYLACVGAYIKLNNKEYAQKVCDFGIDIAKESIQEPWAKELILQLTEAKEYVKRK